MVPVSESFKQQITLQSPLLNMSDPHGVTAGVLMLGENPMIVASRPIVHTDFSGIPSGVVIMGRYLDPAEVSYLASLTQPSLQFVRVKDPTLPPTLLSELEARGTDDTPVILTSGRTNVSGYALIKDIYGNDALVLQITQPRDIYQQGISTTIEYILIILAICLAFGVAIILIIDQLVLSRLSTLNQQVQTISRGTDASKRVELSDDDEFFHLAGGINQMLETIYTTQQRLLVSETRFRQFTDLIPQIIFELDISGNLTYLNKFGMELTGMTPEDIGPLTRSGTFILPDEQDELLENLKSGSNTQKSSGKVYSLVKKDGTRIKAIISIAPIILNGTLQGFRGSAFDITDRIALEDALSESQKYLKTLLWSIQVGIIVIDADTHIIIDANPAALNIIKMTREELVNSSCHESFCPDEEGRCLITDQGNYLDNVERTLRTGDGRVLSIIKSVVPIMLKGRNCLLETFIDNTARKQIEEELRQSTDLITGILQASPVGVCQLDALGNIIFVNDMFSKITGIPLDQVNGRYWADIFQSEDCSPLLPTIDTACQEMRILKSEIHYIHPDGSKYWLIWQIVPLIDHTNQLTGWLGTFADITERKKVEDALMESEEKYRALIENTPDLLFSADLDGNVTYISPQVNQYGYLEEDIISHPLFNLIHPEERLLIAEKFHIELNKNARFFSTFRLLDKWENIHWFEEKSFLQLNTFGEPIGSYGVLRDVSERRRAEDAIELANKKLNLMNNITRHDILNTVTGLLGCVDMANATDSEDERTLLLQDIKNLSKTIQRQIAFTKEYQEVGVNLPIWQDVGEVLQGILVNFEGSGLRFVIDLEHVEIYADPLLEKVFYNLVDNAIRYGENITTIQFYQVNSDDGFSLICEDDGVGIPVDMKDYIFERGVGKNTGMGLFLSREILGITKIEFHENGIPGKGARFEMYISRGTFRFITEF